MFQRSTFREILPFAQSITAVLYLMCSLFHSLDIVPFSSVKLIFVQTRVRNLSNNNHLMNLLAAFLFRIQKFFYDNTGISDTLSITISSATVLIGFIYPFSILDVLFRL